MSFGIEVRAKLGFGNKTRCLTQYRAQCSRIEFLVSWDGEYFRSSSNDPFQLQVAAALRNDLEPKRVQNPCDLAPR